MSLVREIKRRTRRSAAPTLFAVLTVYFMVHLIEGDRGFRTFVQLRDGIGTAETRLAETAAARAKLEDRTARLRGPEIDPDLLDEQARVMGGLAHPDDLIVLYPKEPPADPR